MGPQMRGNSRSSCSEKDVFMGAIIPFFSQEKSPLHNAEGVERGNINGLFCLTLGGVSIKLMAKTLLQLPSINQALIEHSQIFTGAPGYLWF